MMTREMVIELLKSAGRDLDYYVDEEGDIVVTVEDFKGFDDNWHEIYRDYDKNLISSIKKQIEKAADYCEEDFLLYYQFGDFTIIWGYASDDI